MAGTLDTQQSFLLEGQRIPAPPLAPGLYVTSTPIGNLSDVTLRALRVLAAADTILCEDTRTSAKLARNYGISTPLRPYHDHNAERVRPEILNRLRGGAACALISDAGTPLVSDPGFKLVREAAALGISVFAVPGASAALAAVAIAGLPSDRLHFVGFPPPKKGARMALFAELADIRASLVFFVSPRKLAWTLAEMRDAWGPRQAVVARELTKLHEEALRGSLDELAASVSARQSLKGEVTLVVAPPAADAPRAADIEAHLARALETMSVRDAADMVARSCGVPRRDVYRRALALSQGPGR